MKIGEKLRHYRELRNLSQQHLADAMGISQPHYSRIEKGADITFSQMEKAAKEMDISVKDLVTFDTAQYFNKVDNSQIGYNVYHNSLSDEIKDIKRRLEKLENEMKNK